MVAPSNPAGNLRAFTAGHRHLSSRMPRTAEWADPNCIRLPSNCETHLRWTSWWFVTTTRTEGTPSLWADYNSKEGSRAQRSERSYLRSRDRDRYRQGNKTTFRRFDLSTFSTFRSLRRRKTPACFSVCLRGSVYWVCSWHPSAFMMLSWNFCAYVSLSLCEINCTQCHRTQGRFNGSVLAQDRPQTPDAKGDGFDGGNTTCAQSAQSSFAWVKHFPQLGLVFFIPLGDCCVFFLKSLINLLMIL